MSLAPVTTDHGWMPVFGSGTLASVLTSNMGSIVGTISITAPVVTLVLSVTTDRVAAFCSHSGSFASVVSVIFDAMLVVVSVTVTTDHSKVLDRLDGFTISHVLSLASMGCVTGRSGKVSSGSALSVFVFFAFRQCLGQCPPSLVRL